MSEKTINGLISRFEEKCAHRADDMCVFLTVAEMRLTIRTLKHVNWRFQQQVTRKGWKQEEESPYDYQEHRAEMGHGFIGKDDGAVN